MSDSIVDKQNIDGAVDNVHFQMPKSLNPLTLKSLNPME